MSDLIKNKKNFIFITGGLGFVGTNLGVYLAKTYPKSIITLFDDFSMKVKLKKRLECVSNFKNIKIVEGKIENFKKLNNNIKNHNIVFHLASNADISAAEIKPDIDFYQGAYLTKNVLEVSRLNKIKEFYFTSGSGVYGENHDIIFNESSSLYHPVSPYGANKLSSESLISAYAHMFNIKAISFRLANVVGRFQTHGVIYDFLNKLKNNNRILKVLGNGSQLKSYIYVDDVISGILFGVTHSKKIYETFNIANNDSVTVKFIAKQCIKSFSDKFNSNHARPIYQKQLRGWNGDVPIIKMSTKKINSLGWCHQKTSVAAVKETINQLLQEL
jgi:UDP-glucose 4-epimerase